MVYYYHIPAPRDGALRAPSAAEQARDGFDKIISGGASVYADGINVAGREIKKKNGKENKDREKRIYTHNACPYGGNG